MSDPSERLRVRLGAVFAAREARLRAEHELARAEARRREAFLQAFGERVRDDVRPAFETAADVVEAHGFEGRVKLDLRPEEGLPSVRFEMHPGGDREGDPALGRACLRYAADAENERIDVTADVDGGDHAAFARSHHASWPILLADLDAATIERQLTELVELAVDEEPRAPRSQEDGRPDEAPR